MAHSTPTASQRLVTKCLFMSLLEQMPVKPARVMRSLGLDGDRDRAEAKIGEALTAYLNEKQSCALKKWKEASALWNVQSRDLYRYLRNLHPAKPVVVKMRGGITSAAPEDVYLEFNEYWSEIESWPNHDALGRAWHMLEDRYAAFTPRRKYSVVIEPKDMRRQLRSMKSTSPGLDA